MKCNTPVKHEVYITYPIKHLSCHHGVFHASLDFSLKRRKHNANGYQDTITEYFTTTAVFSTVSRKLKLLALARRSVLWSKEGKAKQATISRLCSVTQQEFYLERVFSLRKQCCRDWVQAHYWEPNVYWEHQQHVTIQLDPGHRTVFFPKNRTK